MKYYKVGDRFTHVDPYGETCLYQIVGAIKGSPNGPCFLASSRCGWSYTGGVVNVVNAHHITPDELRSMTSGHKFTKVTEERDDGEKEVQLNPFPCHACEKHKEGILIRGLCRGCAPGLHKKHDCDMKFMSEMNAKFKEETGKDSLEDWHAFEDWLGKDKL